MNLDRELPRNLEIERAVLGALLLGAEWAVDSLPRLTDKHFFDARHRTIFRAMADLLACGQQAEIIAVANRLDETGHEEEAGGRLYLNELLSMACTDSVFAQFVAILREKSLRRDIEEAGLRIAELGLDQGLDLQEAIARARAAVAEVERDASSATAFGPRLLTDLRSEATAPREDVIGGVLPRGGLLQILAVSKVGKTFLGLSLAKAIAQGAPFLGWTTLAGPVLYLSGEGGPRLITDRLASVGGDASDWPGRLYFDTPLPGRRQLHIDDPAVRTAIILWCRQHGIVAVFIDPLTRFHQQDENDSRGMKIVVDGLLEMACETGAGVVVNHHNRKPSQTSHPGSPLEGRGSSVLHGAVDASWVIYKRYGQLVLNAELRWAESPDEMSLALDSSSLEFTVVGEVAHGNRKLDANRLLALLQEKGPLTNADLMKETRCCERTVRDRMKDLESEGRVTYRSRGRNKVWALQGGTLHGSDK